MDCEFIREARLEVLYGEADQHTCDRVREHEASCPACARETAAFSALRRDLARWTIFEPRVPPAVTRPLIPRWLALAATVALALGGSLGLARPQLSWGDGTVRLGFGPRSAPSDGVVAEAARQRDEIEELRTAISRLEQRRLTPAVVPRSTLDHDEVATLVRASEERQLRVLESRLVAFGDRLSTQRRLDFARMSAGLAYLDQRSGRDAARTNELMGHILQVSERR